MSYRKVKKYFQNIKLYGIIGAAVIMAMSVTACSTVKNSGTEITADQTSAGATVNGIYSYDDMFTERDLDVGYDESSAVKINLADDSTTVTVGDDTEADTSEIDETKADETQADESETNGTKADKSETNGTKADESETDETKVASSGVSISGNIITISKEGTYVLSGALSEGQIVVDADSAKVQLVLDNVDITCASSAAIYVKNADKTFITLAEDSENILMNTAEYEAIDDNNIDAVIFSKDDLTLNGKGTLTINSEYGHGIVSKDDLKLVSGTCNITAKKHALSGKDSVRIAAGTYNLTSGKDGIHSENVDDDEKGFVYIASGDFTIESTGDGIDASYVVQIDDGDFEITAGGGSENATKTHNDMPGGGPGGDMGGGAPSGEAPSGDKPSGEAPSGGPSSDGDSGKQTGQTPPDKPDGDSFDGSRPDEKASDNADSQTSQTPPDKSGKDTSDGQQFDKNSQSKDAADSTTASGASSDTDSEAASGTSSDTGSEAASSASYDTDTTSTKGIKSDGALYVNGGTFTINSADDSFHSNSDVTINDGTYTISSGDDGMHADSALLVNGGTITVTESYEGLEGLNVTINDGKIDITASDDGMNAAGGNDQSGFGGMGGDGFKGMQAPNSAPDAAQKSDSASDSTSDNTQKSDDTSDTAQTTGNITVAAQKSDDASDTVQDTGNITVAAQKSDSTSDKAQDTDTASEDEMWMVINGGYVHVLAGGDGLDSNGDLTINGGEVYVDGPSDNGNSAIDYGEKSSFYINGGTVVAVGSSGMAEDVSSDSKQQVVFVKLDSQADAGDVILKDADGNEIISYTAQKKYDCVIISMADLKAGQTYTLSASGSESEVSL